MGRDKALVPVGSPPTPMAVRVAAALRDGGCTDVTCVGGDADALTALGLTVVADDHPGLGPLGGVLTGLRTAAQELLVVLACDLPRIDGVAVRALVRELAGRTSADAAVPVLDGRLQVHAAAFRRTARPALAAAFESGERSLTRALATLDIVRVEHLDPLALADVDSPEDLGR